MFILTNQPTRMNNANTRYELIRALDFLTLLGLLCFMILIVDNALDIVMSLKSEFDTNMIADLTQPMRLLFP